MNCSWFSTGSTHTTATSARSAAGAHHVPRILHRREWLCIVACVLLNLCVCAVCVPTRPLRRQAAVAAHHLEQPLPAQPW